MLAEERQRVIAEKIIKNGCVSIVDLSKELDVSFPTIRRDLDILEQNGFVKKIHGGAITCNKELTFSERDTSRKAEKEIIAETAAGFITDNDIIFLDAGTTVFHMVNHIKDMKNIVVLTNSIKIATFLMDYANIVHYLIGGSIKPVSMATVGAEAINNIKKFRVNKLFLGADGIGEDAFTVQDINEAMTKRAMMEIAREKYLLVDSLKIGKPTFIEVGKLQELNAVITENGKLHD